MLLSISVRLPQASRPISNQPGRTMSLLKAAETMLRCEGASADLQEIVTCAVLTERHPASP